MNRQMRNYLQLALSLGRFLIMLGISGIVIANTNNTWLNTLFFAPTIISACVAFVAAGVINEGEPVNPRIVSAGPMILKNLEHHSNLIRTLQMEVSSIKEGTDRLSETIGEDATRTRVKWYCGFARRSATNGHSIDGLATTSARGEHRVSQGSHEL